MARIANDADDNVRRLWSQHFLNNAFDYVTPADQIRGIFGATPVETMHALRKGIVEMVTFSVLDNVPASKKHNSIYQQCVFTKPIAKHSAKISLRLISAMELAT
jgi:hypothetical protein